MAYVRVFQRRLASMLSENRYLLPNNRALLIKGSRSLQVKTESAHESQDPDAATNVPPIPTEVAENANCRESKVRDAKPATLSDLKTLARHDLAMVFTCKVRETRSVKTFCRESYEKGVVIVRCDGFSNLHLIADRLGWFGEPGDIESLLISRGEEVRKGSIDSLSLTLEDLLGTKPS